VQRAAQGCTEINQSLILGRPITVPDEGAPKPSQFHGNVISEAGTFAAEEVRQRLDADCAVRAQRRQPRKHALNWQFDFARCDESC